MRLFSSYFDLTTPSWKHGWELLIAMTEREIKARYRYAILGFLWIILNPVLQMVIIGGVFSFVFKTSVVDYFLYLFTGLLVWNYFSLSFLKTTPGIVFELPLIEKAKFPREVIVLSIILSNLFHTLIAFGLFVIVLIALQKVIIWKLIFLPILLIWTTVLLTGMSFITSALNVKYRDITFFVQAFVPLWFYATPIVYFSSVLPSHLQTIIKLNPLTSMIETYQSILLSRPMPDLWSLGLSIFETGVLFIAGVLIFRHEAQFFDDWI